MAMSEGEGTSTDYIVKKQVLKKGKTKTIWEINDVTVLVQSQDLITAYNGAQEDLITGKGVIANRTTSNIFLILAKAGIREAFLRKHEDNSFIAHRCEMLPIEWVARRIATGSYLKRYPGINEGTVFPSLKLETFFKDDSDNDPEWSEEQILAKQFTLNNRVIGQTEIDIMKKTTAAVFEILEKYWSAVDCTLVDMKVEFGVNKAGQLLLADVIDNDSWRLWENGDSRRMRDKQVYRNLKKVTDVDLEVVKSNYRWVADKTEHLMDIRSQGLVVIVAGSASDNVHCEDINHYCLELGILSTIRIASAHKSTEDVLQILKNYDVTGRKIVYVAVAGRSNGLGLVMAANTVSPVINCPPPSANLSQDIWSSLRVPSGLGCSTVIGAEAAAICAAQILGLYDVRIWSIIRAKQLNNYVDLKENDQKTRAKGIPDLL